MCWCTACYLFPSIWGHSYLFPTVLGLFICFRLCLGIFPVYNCFGTFYLFSPPCQLPCQPPCPPGCRPPCQPTCSITPSPLLSPIVIVTSVMSTTMSVTLSTYMSTTMLATSSATLSTARSATPITNRIIKVCVLPQNLALAIMARELKVQVLVPCNHKGQCEQNLKKNKSMFVMRRRRWRRADQEVE